MDDGSFAPAMLEVLSAHLRGHDLSGAGRAGRSEGSGYFEDLLGATAMALGGCRFTVASIEADADLVTLDVRAEGSFDRPLLERSPTGCHLVLPMRITYRFDHDGMIVELWQSPGLEVLDRHCSRART